MTALQTTQDSPDSKDSDRKYTVITFAPVQGFIEKSRKLRDLYGASQILSYLSYCLVKEVEKYNRANLDYQLEVISPAGTDLIQGMPNRILILGEISHDRAFNLFRDTLNEAWGKIVKACKDWAEAQITGDYDWDMSWKRWEMHAWEIFVGQNNSKDDASNPIDSAMRDLETRKLRRAWTVPNWNGESSSLSGHDAIAYPYLDRQITHDNKRNEGREKQEIENFYAKLANALENSKEENEPKFLDPSERLSIPELIKRLVTHHQVYSRIPDFPATKKFSELLRKEDDDEKAKRGYWTGWFMGDGDKVGDYLKSLTDAQDVTDFSQNLRNWGKQFQDSFHRKHLGRVVYAGGDDFLGVMYGIRNGTEEEKQRKGTEVIDWLISLHQDWQSGNLGISLSVGFVWAGHSVPQRDVLQHCREAEKLAKNLGRDRVTIRVVFNNGQYVQWTTPWKYLEWLKDYKDRDGKRTYNKNEETNKYKLVEDKNKRANWNHVYSDLAQLKARHAIPPETADKPKDDIAIELLSLYFDEDKDKEKKKMLSKSKWRKHLTGVDGDKQNQAVIAWIEGMIQVGWQLC